MYIQLDKNKDCEILHDGPVFSKHRTPHSEQKGNCFDHNQNLVRSPGRVQHQDGQTD